VKASTSIQPAPLPTVSASEEPVVLRSSDARGVVTLTLNRPHAFNALSEATLTALQRELDTIAQDESVRVVVLAAEGKAFCAGHDLKEMRAAPSLEYYERLFAQCSDMMLTIQRLPVRFALDRAGLVGADGPTHAGAEQRLALVQMNGARIVELRDLTGAADASAVRAKEWSDGWNWSTSIGNGHTTSATANWTSSKGSPSSPHWSASIGTGQVNVARADSTQPATRGTTVSALQVPGPHWTSKIGSARAAGSSTAEKRKLQS